MHRPTFFTPFAVVHVFSTMHSSSACGIVFCDDAIEYRRGFIAGITSSKCARSMRHAKCSSTSITLAVSAANSATNSPSPRLSAASVSFSAPSAK